MRFDRLMDATATLATGGPTDVDVRSIAYDSRRCVEGSLFVALPGAKVDGAEYIGDALSRGAVAVVAEREFEREGIAVARVADARLALAEVGAAFWRRPTRRLRLLGVTGTNGKTTVTYLAREILRAAGWRCGLIGTVGYEVGERVLPATRTTPESLDLQALFAQMRDEGCRGCAMEVSSHALAQRRVEGVEFDVAVFTNLTRDHLDFHGTMEAYFEAKARLFELASLQRRKRAVGVINIDDPYGDRLAAEMAKRMEVITYGRGARADVRADDVRIGFEGTTFRLEARRRSYLVRLPIIGFFNVYNALAALAATMALGISARAGVRALAGAAGAPGRLQAIPARRRYRVFVDYAHTPDALENVLLTLRDLGPERLTVVFGCGGERDRGKRPLMGAVAERLADRVLLTSDNPRGEDPARILHEIRQGMRGAPTAEIPDRREAIFRAVAEAVDREVILIAGKGHETYQEVGEKKALPFDDAQVARWAMDEAARAAADAAGEDAR